MARGRKRIHTEIIGKASGLLTILYEVDSLPNTSNDGRADRKISCLCACGNKKILRLNDFLQGKSKSCGCAKGPKRQPRQPR